MQHFTSIHDVADIDSLIRQALQYKATPLADQHLGAGKRLGMIMLNPSLRTRLSTQVAAQNLGITTFEFHMDKDGWAIELEEGVVMNGKSVEHIKDAAPILGSYCDLLALRNFPSLTDKTIDREDRFMNQLIKYSGVPVISLEGNNTHPLQSLADAISITETPIQKPVPKVVLSWAPHIKPIPHCVANSFAEWMGAWEAIDLTITCPEGYELDTQYTDGIPVEHDQHKALQDADFVYVKNWSSYKDYGKVLCTDNSWMLTLKHLQQTNNARVMHCLPVRRNIELSDEVLDSAHSMVTQQATNRVWSAQAVLATLLKNKTS